MTLQGRTPRLARKFSRVVVLAFLMPHLAAAAPRASSASADHLKCWRATALSMMCNSAAESGDFTTALQYGGSWLGWAVQCRDTALMVEAQSVLASVFIELEQPDSALVHANIAVELSHSTPERETATEALLALSKALEATGHHDSSTALLRSALRHRANVSDSLWVGAAFTWLANRALARGANDEALSLVDSALASLRGAREPSALSNGLAARGECLSRLGRYREACSSFESGYGFQLERQRRAFSSKANRYLTDRWRASFSTWIHACLAQASSSDRGTGLAALAVAERGRAQELIELVQPAKTLVESDSLVLSLVPTSTRLFGPGRDLGTDAATALKAAIPPNCGLLYYSQLPESLIIWVAARGFVQVVRLASPARLPERMAPLAVGIVDSAMAPPEVSDWWFRKVQSVGKDSLLRLFTNSCLPDTVVGLLRGTHEVVIIADDWLHDVPFAALPAGPRGVPFGILHALRFAPSLAFLAEVEHRNGARRPPRTPNEVLVMGDPFPPPDDLPGARAEAESVAAMFGIKPVLGVAASESTLIARWHLARLIHLASHGLAYTDPKRTMDSFVALAPSQSYDGHLSAAVILTGLPGCHAELVVLSACQTARGLVSQSEGVLGLPWALMATGAQSVMASMWNLPDGSTSWLVQHFYQHLLSDVDHPSKAEALRRAMIDTRERWSDPLSWAPFKLYGAW